MQHRTTGRKTLNKKGTNRMKLTRQIPYILLLLIFVLSGCRTAVPAGPGPQAVTPTPTAFEVIDGLDRLVKFDQTAAKIISIAPSNTEILFAIGAGEQVIARDEFSDYPEAAKALPSVGGGFGALDVEKMVSLQPDLVLASALTPADQVEALEKLGLKVYLLGNPQDLESMFQNLEIAGRITGKSAQAAELVEQLKGRVAAVDKALTKAQSKPVVFYQLDSTDPNAPWTAGAGTFISSLIARAGGENYGDRLKDSYAQISIEQLLLDQPQVILVGDFTWGGVTAEQVQARPSWADLEAIKSGQVFVFDDNLVSRPGPRMVEGLEAMAKFLHPELFR
jgi:iron complex transport system substrate-binding protein